MARATFLNHSSSSIDIRVVDATDPVWVKSDDFVGTANNGLPTIEIHEKFIQPGDELRFWGDVELLVTVRAEGGSENPIKSAFDKIFDRFFNFFDWGNDGQQVSWPEDEPETVDWQDDIVIGIDKFVENRTDVLWRDFRIEIGTGIGDGFVPSDSMDNLYIVSDPMAKEVTSFYNSPPQQEQSQSDFLQWNSDGVSRFGQGDGEQAGFWFGVHIPHELFEPDPHDSESWRARITLRQHTGIPEPATGVLLLAGAVMSLLCRNWKLS